MPRIILRPSFSKDLDGLRRSSRKHYQRASEILLEIQRDIEPSAPRRSENSYPEMPQVRATRRLSRCASTRRLRCRYGRACRLSATTVPLAATCRPLPCSSTRRIEPASIPSGISPTIPGSFKPTIETRAKLSGAEALIEHLQLVIAKMKRAMFGPRSERSQRLIDQLELQLEELAAAAGIYARFLKYRYFVRLEQPLIVCETGPSRFAIIASV